MRECGKRLEPYFQLLELLPSGSEVSVEGNVYLRVNETDEMCWLFSDTGTFITSDELCALCVTSSSVSIKASDMND